MKQVCRTTIKEYVYDSKEERDLHVEEMTLQGWECSGQVKNRGIELGLGTSDYVWYAKFGDTEYL